MGYSTCYCWISTRINSFSWYFLKYYYFWSKVIILSSNIDEKFLVELKDALSKHHQRSKELYTGPYHFEKENNLIELIRNEIDYQLKIDTIFIGNEQLIKILRNNV